MRLNHRHLKFSDSTSIGDFKMCLLHSIVLFLENKDDHEKVVRRLESVEEKISEIDKIKWMTVGCGVILTILTAAISSLASGWWTPSEMQMQRQGHVHQQNVTESNLAD